MTNNYTLEVTYTPKSTKKNASEFTQSTFQTWIRDKRKKATLLSEKSTKAGNKVSIQLSYQPGERTLNHLQTRLSKYAEVKSFKVR